MTKYWTKGLYKNKPLPGSEELAVYLAAEVEALEQDKADSQTANAALRDELEQLRVDYRSEQRMSEDLEQQLTTMTQERDDLQARLMSLLDLGNI